MPDESKKSKPYSPEHQKVIDDTKKLVTRSKEHISLLKKSAEQHQKILNQQCKDLDEIIENLRKLKD